MKTLEANALEKGEERIGSVQSHLGSTRPHCHLDKGKGDLVHTYYFSIHGAELQGTTQCLSRNTEPPCNITSIQNS